MPVEQRQQVPTKSYVIKESTAYFWVNIILTVVIFGALLLISRFLLDFVRDLLSMDSDSRPLLNLIRVIILLFAVFSIGTKVINWRRTTYTLDPSLLRIQRRGIMSKKEKVFDLEQTKSLSTSKDIFGKMFDYGELNIYTPVLEDTVTLKNIPTPEKYQQLLLYYLQEIRNPQHITNYVNVNQPGDVPNFELE